MRHTRWITVGAAMPVAAVLAAGSIAVAGGWGSAAAPITASASASARGSASADGEAAPSASAVDLDVVLAAAVVKAPFARLTATQIKNLSVATAAKASSVHVTGTIPDGKEKVGIDLVVGKTGASGSITTRLGVQKVIQLGSTVYFQASDDYWASKGYPRGLLTGKWIQLPQTDLTYQQIVSTTTVGAWSKLVAQYRVTSRKPGPTFGGTPTVTLVKPGRQGALIYVASSGPAFPRYVLSSDKVTRLALYQWNAAVTFTAPPAETILSLPTH